MKKLNTVISSRINRSVVLAQIHRHPMISRAQLADMTELDRSAITQILNFLLDAKLVIEVEKGKSGKKGGRAPIHLSVEYNARTMIVVEITLKMITAVITNLAGEERARAELRIKRGDPLMDCLTKVLDELKLNHEQHFNEAVLITVGTPGVVDREKGVVVLNWLHSWRNVPLADELKSRYGKAAYVENDANASAVGELARLEKEMPCRSLLYLYLRDSPGRTPLGVGGALILNGQLWQGAHCFSGESADTINAFFQRTVDKYDPDCKEEERNLTALLARAEAGDIGARKALRVMASRLGDLLAEIAAFVDPDAVMVAIDPPGSTESFWEMIVKEYSSQLSPMAERRIPLVRPVAETNAILEGLVVLSLEKLFIRDASQMSLLVL